MNLFDELPKTLKVENKSMRDKLEMV